MICSCPGGSGRVGWLESTLAGIAGSIERAVFTEEHARRSGWLQRVDPRVKVLMFLAVVIAASASTSLPVLAALYLLLVAAAFASRLPLDVFVRRTWLGIPFFAGIVILPSVFFGAPPRLFEAGLGPLRLGLSEPGLYLAAVFVVRVGVCVSLAVLLVLTTRWSDLLKSLRALRVPQAFILVLSMTYRYVFLFLHTVNGLFEARKSRVVARRGGGQDRRWIARSMGVLLNRSFKMSTDVYAAMLARGFGGEVRTYAVYRLRLSDWLAFAAALAVAAGAGLAGRVLS
jgi:cobalt/nickel transport system permease protein